MLDGKTSSVARMSLQQYLTVMWSIVSVAQGIDGAITGKFLSSCYTKTRMWRFLYQTKNSGWFILREGLPRSHPSNHLLACIKCDTNFQWSGPSVANKSSGCLQNQLLSALSWNWVCLSLSDLSNSVDLTWLFIFYYYEIFPHHSVPRHDAVSQKNMWQASWVHWG